MMANPTRRQLMMLADKMGMADIANDVVKFALVVLARWLLPAHALPFYQITMTELRDFHLPEPAVCDWLLSLKWSSVIPETRIEYPDSGLGEIKRTVQYNFRVARAALGADEMIDLAMPVEAYVVLQEDALARGRAMPTSPLPLPSGEAK